jgi:hypothetical protein
MPRDAPQHRQLQHRQPRPPRGWEAHHSRGGRLDSASWRSGKLQAEVIGRALGGRKHAPKANEEAPGGHPGACRIFPLMCDQYLAVTGPAPALNRKLRPTLKTFLVSLTSNSTEPGPPTKQATTPHTALCERVPKS